MAFEIKSTIRNKDRLFQKLKALNEDVAREVVEANERLADEMVLQAQRLVPVEHGDLQDSIVATYGGQQSPAYSQPGGSMKVPEGSVLVTAGNSRVRYPHLVEFGTRPHVNAGKFPGTENPGAPAQPYFWPSFRLIRSRLRRQVSAAVRRAVRKATAGAS